MKERLNWKMFLLILIDTNSTYEDDAGTTVLLNANTIATHQDFVSDLGLHNIGGVHLT